MQVRAPLLAAAVAAVAVACAPTGPGDPAPSNVPHTAAPVAPSPTDPTPTSSPAASATPAPAQVPAGAQLAEVVRHVDGDTLWVTPLEAGPLATNASHAVRLLEVDAPESNTARYGHTECYGDEASAWIAERLPTGTRVWLEVDRDPTDRYDRALRYIWTEHGMINLELVEAGMARAVLYAPNDRHIDAMRAAERDARDAGRGLWGACEGAGGEATAAPAAAAGCDDSYPDVCVPPAPPDLDCGDVDHRRFRVTGDDPHGFDTDGDGVACES